MKLKIKERTYSPFYRFDGGQYFVPGQTEHGGEAWVALMDDGSLQWLFCGRHEPCTAAYEIIKEDTK